MHWPTATGRYDFSAHPHTIDANYSATAAYGAAVTAAITGKLAQVTVSLSDEDDKDESQIEMKSLWNARLGVGNLFRNRLMKKES